MQHVEEALELLIKTHYPNAEAGDEAVDKYLRIIKEEYHVDLSKTLFATSICSDDANFSADFSKVLSRPFVMGGLGGLPYTGYTGMVAYAHHIPDQGHAFIFYGPHIGINKDGVIGKMRRQGQSNDTNSCGALMLALERLTTDEDEEIYIPFSSEIDYQQTLLERSLMPFKHEIVNSKFPKKEITDLTYNIIHKLVHKCLGMAKDEFHCNKIILLGGIIINTDPEYQDYIEIKNFEVLETCDILGIKPADAHKLQAFKDL